MADVMCSSLVRPGRQSESLGPRVGEEQRTGRRDSEGKASKIQSLTVQHNTYIHNS